MAHFALQQGFQPGRIPLKGEFKGFMGSSDHQFDRLKLLEYWPFVILAF